MAVAVIDRLEVIEVEVNDGKCPVVPLRLIPGEFEAVEEHSPVRQAGQRVEMHLSANLRLLGLAGGEVLDMGDEQREFAIVIVLRTEADFDPYGGAVLAAVALFIAQVGPHAVFHLGDVKFAGRKIIGVSE